MTNIKLIKIQEIAIKIFRKEVYATGVMVSKTNTYEIETAS